MNSIATGAKSLAKSGRRYVGGAWELDRLVTDEQARLAAAAVAGDALVGG